MRTDTLEAARAMDAADPLSAMRQSFLFPPHPSGNPPVYLCGNSLGLQPKGVRQRVNDELDHWAKHGVEGHFEGDNPWFSYHEPLSAPMAHVVGAQPHEVVVMNALTVNLHLMMVSFYRPTPKRHKILIEASAFPSDLYAVASQARMHGYDPKEAVVEMHPREGEETIRTEDIEALLERDGEQFALVMFGGVNYYTGQAFEMERITAAGHKAGAMVGFDLAHAAGNLHLKLHDWGVDFGVWCSYKYLNSGPGGVAGCFVHDRHGMNPDLVRMAGWWGNDPTTRFEMPREFVPQRGAGGWQLSNAPVLPMASLSASLELFTQATMPALRERSERMTAYLVALIDGMGADRFRLITPRDPSQRGCQVSIQTLVDGRALFEALGQQGVTCDFRRPDVIRVAPVPLYNSFEDIWRFAQILREAVG